MVLVFVASNTLSTNLHCPVFKRLTFIPRNYSPWLIAWQSETPVPVSPRLIPYPNSRL